MATLVVAPPWGRSEEFSAPRGLADVLVTFLGPGKISGPCRRVVGRRKLLATGGLGLLLEMS